MRLNTYQQLLRKLAQRHKRIAATPDNGRFIRLLLSADPVQKQLDLTEFYKMLRNELRVEPGQPFLVSENYQLEYTDNKGDAQQRVFQGAYLVLEPIEPDDYNGRDEAISRCEEIAEQVLGALVPALYDNHGASYVPLGETWLEHIGPIATSYVGVRLNFTWLEPATQDLTYNPDAFN